MQRFVVLLPDFATDELDLLLAILYGVETAIPAGGAARVLDLADAIGVTVDLPFLSGDEDGQNEVSALPTASAPLCCWHCNRVFPELNALKQHVTSHEGERFKRKHHRCQFCKKFFPSMWRLRQHLITHRRMTEVPSSQPGTVSTGTTATAASDHSYSGSPLHQSMPSVARAGDNLMTTIEQQPASCGGELGNPLAMRAKPDRSALPPRRASSSVARPVQARSDHLYSAKHLTEKEAAEMATRARKEMMTQKKKATSDHDHLYSSQPSSPTSAPISTSLRQIRAKRQSVQAMGHSYAAARPRPPPTSTAGRPRPGPAASTVMFGCDRCDRAFPQPYRLNRHIREVHERVKVHACRVAGCSKAFFKVTSRNRHELTHDGQHDKWKCGRCLKCFRDQTALNYHVAKKVCSKK